MTFPEAGKPPRPDVLDGAGDQPVVLVTFGTVFNRTPGVFEMVLEALAELPVVAVVTVGPTRDPSGLEPVADNVRVRRFVAYDALLPHCDLVLSHGGWGTVMAALAHALPQVLVPLSSDQPWHAERCLELGVAQAVPFTEADPGKIRQAVTAVLADDGYRRRAAEEQAALRSLPPPAAVVPRLEQLAHAR